MQHSDNLAWYLIDQEDEWDSLESLIKEGLSFEEIKSNSILYDAHVVLEKEKDFVDFVKPKILKAQKRILKESKKRS